MNRPKNDSDFYIGYLGETSMETRRFLKAIIVALFFFVSFAAVSLGIYQKKMDRGTFDFGSLRSYEGILYAAPIPMIHTKDRTYLLVGDQKFGAQDWVKKWTDSAQNHPVKLWGTLIERSPIAMLEIDRHSEPEILKTSFQKDVSVKVLPGETLGEFDLEGELVDSKCYLGVMRPATGKVHKGCAIRCLSGGVPPGLLLRNPKVDASVLILLSSADGMAPVQVQSEWAARTIRVHGILELKGGIPILRTQKLALLPKTSHYP